MASIKTGIELNDQFTGVLNNIIYSVNSAVSAMYDMNESMNADIDTSSLESAKNYIDNATLSLYEMNDAAQDLNVTQAEQSFEGLDQQIQQTPSHVDAIRTGVQGLNSDIQDANKSAGNLNGTLGKAAGAIVSIGTVKKVYNMVTDAMDAYNTQINAETQLMAVMANMMNEDVVQDYVLEVSANTSDAVNAINGISAQVKSVDITPELQTAALQKEYDKVINKASEIQNTGIYGDEAMIAGAAELATYFDDVNAITTMMDTLSNYAMGMTGGGAVDAKTMTDYATNLGKIMTGSYDAMTKKGFEFNDTQKAIIEGEATEQQIVQQLGEEYLNCSDDMRAAAAITQVIDDSWADLYTTMSNTPQGQIIQLTNAFGDMQEMIAGQLYPYIMLFVQTIQDNWPVIEQIVEGIVGALQTLIGILSLVMDVAFSVAQVIIDNWDWLSAVVGVVVAAFAAYYAIQLVVNTATAIWNAICSANPLVIILMAIIAAVALVAYVISNLSTTTKTAFGVITGAINVAMQFFVNLGMLVADIALGIVNAIGALCTNIVTAFSNAIANVQIFFYNLLSTALNVISQIANALNKLPFVSIDVGGLTAAADSYAAKAAEIEGDKGEYVSISDAFSEGFSTYDAFASEWISDAYAAGSSWGDNVADSISDVFDTSAYSLNASDFTNSMTGALNNSDINDALGSGGLGGSSGRTADNTGLIADELNITNDELKYLRDIAEQEAINRYTLATVNIDQSGMTNQINSGDDIDSFMTQLTDAVNEAVETMTEGVHA